MSSAPTFDFDSAQRRFTQGNERLRFVKRSRLAVSAARLFAWHQSAEALPLLIPPWENVRVEQPPVSLADGERAVLRIGCGPFYLRWVAEHRDFIDRGEEGGEFTDLQIRGPFRFWRHRHIVRDDGFGFSILEDCIDYELRGGVLGRLLTESLTRRKLERMFSYRHEITRAALEGLSEC